MFNSRRYRNLRLFLEAFIAASIVVGVALRGHPSVGFRAGEATEGHAYNASFTLTVFAGMPTTMLYGSTSRVTRAPVPIIAWSPMVVPASTVA